MLFLSIAEAYASPNMIIIVVGVFSAARSRVSSALSGVISAARSWASVISVARGQVSTNMAVSSGDGHGLAQD